MPEKRQFELKNSLKWSDRLEVNRLIFPVIPDFVCDENNELFKISMLEGAASGNVILCRMNNLQKLKLGPRQNTSCDFWL